MFVCDYKRAARGIVKASRIRDWAARLGKVGREAARVSALSEREINSAKKDIDGLTKMRKREAIRSRLVGGGLCR